MIVNCPRCRAMVDARVESQHGQYVPPDEGLPERVSLVVCPTCNHPMLVGQESYGEDHSGHEIWSDPYRLYPPRQRELSRVVPEDLRFAFGEARQCHECGAYNAAALMSRKALETLCSLKGPARVRNLRDALKAMKESGVIDGRLFEWAQELRATGNEAAHGVSTRLSREDAEDMLSLTEAIIDYVYVFADRFDQFRARRSQS